MTKLNMIGVACNATEGSWRARSIIAADKIGRLRIHDLVCESSVRKIRQRHPGNQVAGCLHQIATPRLPGKRETDFSVGQSLQVAQLQIRLTRLQDGAV